MEEELAGAREPTQVKLALDRLGIEVVYALSPQAKGRIERAWGTLQDRLVSEPRLAGAKTRGQANVVLERYRLEHNRRFAVAAHDSQPGWRRAPTDDRKILELCALQCARRVRRNNTVLVRHFLSGRIQVYWDGQCVASAEGKRPKAPQRGARTLLGVRRRRRQKAERDKQQQADEEDAG